MSSTLRDTAEHTAHTISDLVGDAMHHLDLPHVDLARITGRRRVSPASIAAIVAAVLLVSVIATRVMRGRRKPVVVLEEVVAEHSKKGKKSAVAA